MRTDSRPTSRFHFRLASPASARLLALLGPCAAGATTFGPRADSVALAQEAPTPSPVAAPAPIAPPASSAYVVCAPKRRVSYGRTLVPLSFLTSAMGASVARDGKVWRVAFFGHTAEMFPYQQTARLDSQEVTLPIAPQVLGGVPYVPWVPLAQMLGVKWKVAREDARSSTFLLQFPAAFIESARSQVSGDKVRLVLTLSNPTRVSATLSGRDTTVRLPAARRAGVPSLLPVNDYLVPRGLLSSGNWQAQLRVRVNYSAPVQWHTLGFPARIVIDVQRLFEEKSEKALSGGLSLVRVRKGLADGPVQMYVVRVDPRDGWRMKLAGSGGVLTRARPSRIASRHRALVAVNGGFFAYDGAAVGAVLSDGEWIRLPWKGRTGLGFRSDGSARIANLQARAHAHFGDGSRVPIRDLNGWPDMGRVTALTRRFRSFYQLRPGEMALEVSASGVVASKPGGGGVNIPAGGFVLIASGGARPALERIARGTKAFLYVHAPGWEGFNTALGGGPRLVNNGRIEVTALREAFKSDVRVGRAPRTAFGIDRQGRYILLVADGRQPYYSVGLTLSELAATMQKLGAVDALNLDGGGSTAMAIRSRVVNRPSDGSERAVSNALLVMRG